MSRLLIKIIIIFIVFIIPVIQIEAGLIDDIKNKINKKNNDIQSIEKEINKYEKQIVETGKKAKTLKNKISRLDITRNKLGTDIRLTKYKISGTNLSIKKINLEIANKEQGIFQNRKTISQTVRQINEIDSNSFVEMLLSQTNLSEFWSEVEDIKRLQKNINDDVKKLKLIKSDLEKDKTNKEKAKFRLLNLKGELSDQKSIVDNNRYKKKSLLNKTKNKESNYKKLLKEKKALKEAFEKEILAFESELKIAIDPNSLPKTGSGVLSWPLAKIHITQYFGNTRFAKSGAYNGRGHNGIDLRASVGTKVVTALSGTVVGVGNTDAIKGCYSYGKWILVKHKNGLTTLYAHLSLIKVSKGQNISTGDLIGYSGNTGYSIGPHLHFTVYASQGVQIVRLGDIKKITNCGNARIPVAPLPAYLNPLDYL